VAGEHTYDIKSGYVIAEDGFPEDQVGGAYHGDAGDPDWAGCDQIAVISSKTDDALFGGIGGVSDYDTALRSVGRVTLDVIGEAVPAFLMLERTNCDTLSEIVGTGGGSGIIVDAASPTEPGLIHVDSAGSAGCNNTNTVGGVAVFSDGIGGVHGIVVNGSADGKPGLIEINALNGSPTHAAYRPVPGIGISPAPLAGDVVSRQPVDDHYNSPGEPTITDLHSDAYQDTLLSAAPSDAEGAQGEPVSGAWRTLGCGDTSGTISETKVFVNCATYEPVALELSNATDIIFSGSVQVSGAGGGRSLAMPAARRITIAGNSTRGLDVDNNARLGINSASPLFADTDAAVSGACSGRDSLPHSQTTRLVVFGGSSTIPALDVAGRAAMCQTSVYLAGPDTNSSYVRQALTNGTYDSTCVAETPCPSLASTSPANTISHAAFAISGYVRWSGPNQHPSARPPGPVGVEDLALWTESHTLSEVKSGGILESFGVFFLPNARVEMRSPASATPRDAQFIAQSLQLLQGTMRMQPTPSNAVPIPVLLGSGMVR
jgi:hypothetical protein